MAIRLELSVMGCYINSSLNVPGVLLAVANTVLGSPICNRSWDDSICYTICSWLHKSDIISDRLFVLFVPGLLVNVGPIEEVCKENCIRSIEKYGYGDSEPVGLTRFVVQ